MNQRRYKSAIVDPLSLPWQGTGQVTERARWLAGSLAGYTIGTKIFPSFRDIEFFYSICCSLLDCL